jgi:uncharacterized small protein (DUF1192 family)
MVPEEATMIDDDPFGSPLKRPVVTLDLMSIDELEAKIAALKEEIAACEKAIAAKRQQRAAADAIFGRPEA